MVGTGFFPTDGVEHLRDRGPTGCSWTGTSEVASGRGCTWARSSTPASCRSATPASRRYFRREAGAVGQGHTRHVPCAPVQQGRDVRRHSCFLRTSAADARSSWSGFEEGFVPGSSGCRTAWMNVAAGDLGCLGRQEGRHRGLVPVRRAATARSRRARTRRTSRRAGSGSATAREHGLGDRRTR